MHGSRSFVWTALFATLLGAAGPAFAQSPANVQVVSGNGQLTCFGLCATLTVQPLVVKVTDANNQPVNGATVNWTITSGLNAGILANSTSTSDSGWPTTKSK